MTGSSAPSTFDFEDRAVTNDDMYFIAMALDMRPTETFNCGIDAVCRTGSRAEAASLFRLEGVGGFSSREVRKVQTLKHLDEFGFPPVETGEVWVRRNAPIGAWVKRVGDTP